MTEYSARYASSPEAVKKYDTQQLRDEFLIDNLMKDKMVISIAHRLSTIKNVDRIIFMQNGKIIEDGNHGDLINKNGSYRDMLEKGNL